MHGESHRIGSEANERLDIESSSRDQWKGYEPDPDDSHNGEVLEPENSSYPKMVQQVSPKKLAAANSHKEPDPDDSEASWKSSVAAEPISLFSQLMEVEGTVQPRKISAEPDPDDSEAKLKTNTVNDTIEDQVNLYKAQREPDPDELQVNEVVREEHDLDDNLVHPQGMSRMQIDEPDPDDQELRRIQDSVPVVCSRLQKAIEVPQAEVNPVEATTVLQTLCKIIRNVIEHSDETKYRRLRKANPIIQRSVANYKAAMEILYLVGFNEDDVSDEIGKAETYLVLKRNDPGLLWLAKSSLKTGIAY